MVVRVGSMDKEVVPSDTLIPSTSSHSPSRRTFLRLTILTALVAPTIPLLSACAVAGNTIFDYLMTLTIGTGANVLGEAINQLIHKPDVRRGYNLLIGYGFNDFSKTQVFENPAFYYYAFGGLNQNGLLCAAIGNPFNIVMLEEPDIVGLALATQDWSVGVRPADGLIPIDPGQPQVGQFGQSYSQVHHYRTKVGSLSVNYRAKSPGNVAGTISVISRGSNGGLLLGRDYQIV